MQTGYSGSPTTSYYLCWVIAAVWVATGSVMEGNTTSPEKLIRQSHRLCAGEQEYIQQRKLIVKDALSELGVNCTAEEVPQIAMLGSGGGQRAAIALLGSLYQLAQDGLLDTMLYLGGVSGSTWSMVSIYSDDQWSRRMDKTVQSLKSTEVDLEQVGSWLNEKSHRKDFSLTDVWGLVTAVGIMKQWDTRSFSHEADRNATNPYPIYGAIEKYCFKNGPTEAKWFELSPHEVGFPELGLFVETSLLGSKFKGGRLIEEQPQLDMIQLQGVLGCALANEETVEQFIPAWLNVPRYKVNAAEKYMQGYNTIFKFITMVKGHVSNTEALVFINQLQETLEDKVNRNESTVLESQSPEEREAQFQQWTAELLTVVQNWAQTLPDGPAKTHVSLLVVKILPLVLQWEWGTIENFLYKYEDVPIPECLHSEEHFHLMDAGFLINVGYPSFLGEKRDIDLIIAPEYSAGDMFETLTLARKYAAEVKKPFPELDDAVLEAEKDWPKDCYVFEGNNAPTIVFMPLFNRENCKDAEEWKQKMEQFGTFQRSFTPAMMEYILETAKTNMKNNKDILLRELNKALQRRNDKRFRPSELQL